jgi:hypothetical protein
LPGTKRQEEGEAGRQRVRPGPHGHQARIPAWALVHVAVMGLGLPLSARSLTGDLVVERRRRAGLSRPMHGPSSCLAERRSRYATRSPGLVLGSREDRRHPKGPAVYVPRAATTRPAASARTRGARVSCAVAILGPPPRDGSVVLASHRPNRRSPRSRARQPASMSPDHQERSDERGRSDHCRR